MIHVLQDTSKSHEVYPKEDSQLPEPSESTSTYTAVAVDSITRSVKSSRSTSLLLNRTGNVLSGPSYIVRSSQKPSIVPALNSILRGNPFVDVNNQYVVSLLV